ncbi:response regulator [Cellulomonas sp. KRMCY2]|uniref:response regulator n=1 Tax=Cellulomonas sp. KRMCY2 TaxID=1304865 RepID=UPI00045E6A60|nr:response regulator [Cellulomonas sp. KRMCY2]
MRVLIADDSRVMRQIVIRTLRQAGYDWWEIIEAPDGAAALETVKAEEPDFVLSDWNMPELSGIDLLRAMRAQGIDTPFAFVTSEGSTEMREQAETAGALFLIAKPFTAEVFRDTIDPFLA